MAYSIKNGGIMLKKCIEYKRFVWELDNVINLENINSNIVFLCIGTNKVAGDCFGPYVGSFLKKSFNKFYNIKVIGDLNNDITYSNIKKLERTIENEYKNSLIIVIDAALSNKENVGKVFVQNRGLKYAQCLRKQNNSIGNISIKAVVGKNANNRFINFKTLKDVSIESVQTLSNFVATGIIEVMNKKEIYGKNIYI